MRNEIVFRIVGQNILPNGITKELGLEPDESFKRGDKFKLRPERNHHNGLWLLKSRISENESLEKHIKEFLQCFENKKEIIKGYSNQDEIWYGIKLDSKILLEIGDSGIDLNIQVYSDLD